MHARYDIGMPMVCTLVFRASGMPVVCVPRFWKQLKGTHVRPLRFFFHDVRHISLQTHTHTYKHTHTITITNTHAQVAAAACSCHCPAISMAWPHRLCAPPTPAHSRHCPPSWMAHARSTPALYVRSGSHKKAAGICTRPGRSARVQGTAAWSGDCTGVVARPGGAAAAG